MLDLTIDGGDEVDPRLDLIKGGGGALLREKIVAQTSRRDIIVVDESKLVPVLGSHWRVPVEVVPFGWRSQAARLEELAAEIVLRRGTAGDPYLTDQDNLVPDCRFGPITQTAQLAGRLEARAGIAGHGLFLGPAAEVIVASSQGIRHIGRREANRR